MPFVTDARTRKRGWSYGGNRVSGDLVLHNGGCTFRSAANANSPYHPSLLNQYSVGFQVDVTEPHAMSTDDPVTLWIDELRNADEAAAQKLWNYFVARLNRSTKTAAENSTGV